MGYAARLALKPHLRRGEAVAPEEIPLLAAKFGCLDRRRLVLVVPPRRDVVLLGAGGSVSRHVKRA